MSGNTSNSTFLLPDVYSLRPLPADTSCQDCLGPCPYAGCGDSNQRTPPHLSFTVRTSFLHPLPAPARVPGPKLHWTWWYIYIYFPCGCMCKCVCMHACVFVGDSLIGFLLNPELANLTGFWIGEVQYAIFSQFRTRVKTSQCLSRGKVQR